MTQLSRAVNSDQRNHRLEACATVAGGPATRDCEFEAKKRQAKTLWLYLQPSHRDLPCDFRMKYGGQSGSKVDVQGDYSAF